jgi:peroxiredoxin
MARFRRNLAITFFAVSIGAMAAGANSNPPKKNDAKGDSQPAAKPEKPGSPSLKVGSSLSLEGKMVNGRNLDWEKYRGKVVLVAFWATWCKYCKAEVPNIKESYKKFRKQGFEVVGISVDDKISRQQVGQFARKNGITWTVCYDADLPKEKRMSARYGVRGLPAMILVGRNGKVVSLEARGPALATQIEKALAAADEVAQGSDDKPAAKAGETAEKRSEPNAPEFRTWTDATGKFHQRAKFRGLTDDIVKLELENGRIVSVPLEKLSDADQEYVRKHRK